MQPGESRRLSRIDVRVTSIGAQIVRWLIVRWQIVRCRIGKSLPGHAATSGPRPCDPARRPSGRSDAPSEVAAFTSAVAAGVGSEQLNFTSHHITAQTAKAKYRAIAPHFPENNSGN